MFIKVNKKKNTTVMPHNLLIYLFTLLIKTRQPHMYVCTSMYAVHASNSCNKKCKNLLRKYN